jgi:hypothetical protein
MKTLKTYILEGSLLDDIEDTLSTGDVNVPRALILEYLEENYRGSWTVSKKPDKDGKFIVNSRGEVHHKGNDNRLTNDMFKWGKVKRFIIKFPYHLESLEGCPREVFDFQCIRTERLKTLEGGPEICKGDYYIQHSSSLESLKGAPKKIGGNFDCRNCCKLTSLEGGPEEVTYSYRVDESPALKSLNGGPKYVGTIFDCSECHSLESIEGGPEDALHFYCDLCPKLKSLKGAPKKIRGSFSADSTGIETLNSGIDVVGRNFSVVHCDKLVSLEGAPKLVRDTFDISNCINIKSLKGLENTEIGNDLCLVRCYGLNDIEDIIKYTPKVGEMIDMHFGGLSSNSVTDDQKNRLKKASKAEVINI